MHGKPSSSGTRIRSLINEIGREKKRAHKDCMRIRNLWSRVCNLQRGHEHIRGSTGIASSG